MSDPENIAIKSDGTIMIRVGGWEYDDHDGDIESSDRVEVIGNIHENPELLNK